MEFEDILKQVGDYGWYQKRLLFFFLVPSTIIFSLICMNTFFMLSEPDHWCRVPIISHLPPEQQKYFSRPNLIPDKSENLNSENLENNPDKCNFYDINYKFIAELYEKNLTTKLINGLSDFNGSLLYGPHNINGGKFNWNNNSQFYDLKHSNVSKCSSWTFDTTDYDETAVTYLNLVCGQDHWKSLILTIHGIGEVVGNPFFGSLSDKFGRHKIFFLALFMACLSSISPLIFRGILVFTIFRFLNSFTAASMYNLPYIVMTEIVGPEHRTKMVGIGATCWTIGMCILPLIAWLLRDWILLTLVPTILVIPFFGYWTFLPESPRWLIAQERYDEAYTVMAKIATVNGKEIPTDLMEQIKSVNYRNRRKYSVTLERIRSESIKSSEKNVENGNLNSLTKSEDTQKLDDPTGSVMDILRKSGLRKKFLILALAWTASVTTYRGLTLNFENFHGNEFVNWFLLSVVEFPSNWLSWYCMETRLGRRWTHSSTMTLGGICLCLPMLLPSAWTSSVIIASMVGKFLCNMAYNVVYQQTAELFPTPVRNSGMSYTTALAAGANFALPYLASLGKVRVWIPLIVMGTISIISGITASFLPETLHENLPQTIDDGDDFGREMIYWKLASRKSDSDADTKIEERKHSLLKP